jgi:hypothetical protein
LLTLCEVNSKKWGPLTCEYRWHDLTSDVGLSQIRSCHRNSQVKGPHFLLLTSQIVINCILTVPFDLISSANNKVSHTSTHIYAKMNRHKIQIWSLKRVNHRGVFLGAEEWSALITDMFFMIAFSIWDLS